LLRFPFQLTQSYFEGQCKAAFGPDTFANTTAFNQLYGGAKPNITRVVALQGYVHKKN